MVKRLIIIIIITTIIIIIIIIIFSNKIENSITFKIKAGYYPQLLTPETMELLESTESKIKKAENDKTVPNSEITEIVLVHFNIFNDIFQQNLRVLYTFVPNKSFGQLLDILLKNIKVLKALESEFSYIEVWFTDENSKLLDIKIE